MTGLGALVLLAMCQKSSTSVAVAAAADPSPAIQPMALDDDRSTVIAAQAECRVEPSAKAALVVRLVRGARLEVLERRGAWAKVSPTGEECWVAASQIDDAPTSDRAPTTLYAPGASGAVPNDPPPLVRSRQPPSAIDRPVRRRSCPCGSGDLFIGPRGGRYCITSGGNKRYGM